MIKIDEVTSTEKHFHIFQDLNIKNADARGAYLNIVGNSIGIVGGAFTRTVTIVATKGMKIGKVLKV